MPGILLLALAAIVAHRYGPPAVVAYERATEIAQAWGCEPPWPWESTCVLRVAYSYEEPEPEAESQCGLVCPPRPMG